MENKPEKHVGEAFTVQTKHGLVACRDYPWCTNIFQETPRWGECCENCLRNRYRKNIESILAPPDNYCPKSSDLEGNEAYERTHSAAAVKEQLIAEVVMKLENIDEKQLVPGCTVLLSVNCHSATIDISIVDNLALAKMLLAQTLEHVQKAAATYLKTTPAETEPSV